ncbi:MAG: FkbM family methyltransferase [Verrucomicrobiales bacterium]|nr:FkbM family methyltransferase [Verrucomicrobiales bacterium]
MAPSIEHRPALERLPVDRVVDAGANRGQFALACRLYLPGIPVHSFEPIPGEAEVFRAVLGEDDLVRLHGLALGSERGEAVLNLSARRDSSSLLPIGDEQARIFASTEKVGELRVPVGKLDDFFAEWGDARAMLLKLDVQGFELSVLKGAGDTLRRCAYVYCECSEVELYTGQALRAEIEGYLNGMGFARVLRLNETWNGGSLVQADYLFQRETRPAGVGSTVVD